MGLLLLGEKWIAHHHPRDATYYMCSGVKWSTFQTEGRYVLFYMEGSHLKKCVKPMKFKELTLFQENMLTYPGKIG